MKLQTTVTVYRLAVCKRTLCCRFHTQFHTWFQRLKLPVRSTSEFEQGHVAFFNWCRPAKRHPLVKSPHVCAEPYPSVSSSGTHINGAPAGDVSAGDMAAGAAAAARGWSFMQIRDFKFDLRYLRPAMVPLQLPCVLVDHKPAAQASASAPAAEASCDQIS